VSLAAGAGCSGAKSSADLGDDGGRSEADASVTNMPMGVPGPDAMNTAPDAIGTTTPDATIITGRDGSTDAGDAGTGAVTFPGCGATPIIHGNLKPLWSLTLGGGNLNGVATDPSGNIIVVGAASGPLTIGSTTIPGPDAGVLNGPFVLKFDSAGTLLWHQRFTGQGNVDAVGVDPAGNIYIAGDFDVGGFSPPTLDLGTGVLQGSFFVAKLDPNGTAQWVNTAQPFRSGNNSYSAVLSLAVDPSGDVAVTGGGAQPAVFGGTTSSTNDHQFLVVWNAAGQQQYAKAFDGSLATVSFDPAGKLFITGGFVQSLDLDTPLAAPPSSSGAAFVALLDPSGHVVWQLADGTFSSGSATAATAGGAFIAGTFAGTAGIASSAAAQGSNDLFLARLDETGHPAFEFTNPGSGTTLSTLAADPGGGVVGAASTDRYIDFGGGPLGPPGIVLAKFDGTGKNVFSARFAVDPYTGINPSSPYVAVDANESVILGGAFYGAIDLGTGPLAGTLGIYPPTMFLAKYAQQAGVSLQGPSIACLPVLDGGVPAGSRLLAAPSFLPNDIALGPGSVYWSTAGEIMSAAIDGGGPIPLAIAQKRPGPLAIDSQSLYWANAGSVRYVGGGGGPGSDGTIVALPLDSGAPVVLATAQDHPTTLAIDDRAAYWTAGGITGPDAGTTAGSVLSVPLQGGTPSVLTSGFGTPEAIAVHGDVVAFASATSGGGSAIASVPRTGGAPTALATTTAGVVAVAVDGANVYWVEASSHGIDTSEADGRILSVPLTGGTPVVLAASLPEPGKMVLLGSTLFWSNAGTFTNVASTALGGVWSVPTSGGASTAVVPNLLSAGPFAIDPAHVAWTYTLDENAAVSGVFVLAR
jgi:hypothetical protein